MARVQLDISDPARLLTLRAILSAEGHAVVDEGPDAMVTDDANRAAHLAKAGPCLLLVTVNEVPSAVKAMREGAFGYLLVPFQPGEAGIMVQRAVEWWRGMAGAPPASAEAEGPLRIDEAETRLILETLRQCRNKKSEAARRLGIGRNTLWRKLKAIGGQGQE